MLKQLRMHQTMVGQEAAEAMASLAMGVVLKVAQTGLVIMEELDIPLVLIGLEQVEEAPELLVVTLRIPKMAVQVVLVKQMIFVLVLMFIMLAVVEDRFIIIPPMHLVALVAEEPAEVLMVLKQQAEALIPEAEEAGLKDSIPPILAAVQEL